MKLHYRFNFVFWSAADNFPLDKLSPNVATLTTFTYTNQEDLEHSRSWVQAQPQEQAKHIVKNNNKDNKANKDISLVR